MTAIQLEVPLARGPGVLRRLLARPPAAIGLILSGLTLPLRLIFRPKQESDQVRESEPGVY